MFSTHCERVSVPGERKERAYKTALCRAFIAGKCVYAEACIFVHGGINLVERRIASSKWGGKEDDDGDGGIIFYFSSRQ
uniref:C3H1-type domain-containing protein n=1 Tax=Ascaris lumbricoides TaxID=6252 RepID=A0A0M3HFN0_ASCLU